MFLKLFKWFLMAGVVFAAVTEPDKMLLSPSRNIIYNGGFEQGPAGWTASGGTFSTTNTAANVGFGNRAGAWLGSASSQTLRSQLVAVPPGLYGRNGVASCLIQVPSGAATHLLQVTDGTNIYGSQSVTSLPTYSRTILNFIFPSSGSLALQLQTVASSEPQIYIDDCFIQPADAINLSQVSQAAFVGQIYFTQTGQPGNFYYPGTSLTDATEYNFTNSPTIVGNVSQASQIGGITQYGIHWTGGPGVYQANFQFAINYAGCSSGGDGMGMEIVDENNNIVGQNFQQFLGASGQNQIPFANLKATWTYTTGGTHDWHMKVQSGNCSYITITNSIGYNGNTEVVLNYSPGPQQLAFNPQTAAWFVDAYYGGFAASTFTGYYPGGQALTVSPGSLPAQVPCSSTNPPQTSNCSSGTSQSGISFNIPAPGAIEVCYQVYFQLSAGTSQNVYVFSNVDWTANSDDSVVVQAGTSQVLDQNNFDATGSSQHGSSPTVCQTFVIPTSGQVTFRAKQQFNVPDALSVGVAHWTARPITQNIPMPILVNSVVSTYPGVIHQEAAICVCNSASSGQPCSDGGRFIAYQTWFSTGYCQINFAPGLFSQTPSCVANAYIGDGQNELATIFFEESDRYQFIFTLANTNARTDTVWNVMCQGY
jgi:hypothetical protein